MSFTYDWPMAATTATGVIFYPHLNKVLLGKRRNVPGAAFPGFWCLPGGFLNVGSERSIDAVSREVHEECRIIIPTDRWRLFYVDDRPGADPRYPQVVNLCFAADATHDDYIAATHGDDLEAVDWFTIEEASKITLAFDHSTILKEFILQTMTFDILD